MAGLADFSRRSAGTEAAHERATRYFNAFLAYKDDDDLGSSWAELIAEKNEQLCDPQLWVEFSGYLVYHCCKYSECTQVGCSAHTDSASLVKSSQRLES
jgi:hypothetical protein